MIILECANLTGLLECASLSLYDGKVYAIMPETDFEKALFLKTVAGLIKLESGRIFVSGTELSSASRDELNSVRKRMGIVLRNGGLVSNLKVWENIMLPLSYHESVSQQDMEEKMIYILNRIGYDSDLNTLPGALPAYKKRLVGLARAMLMEPDIVIYDSLFEGLSTALRDKVHDVVSAFHEEKKGRTSVFFDVNESSLKHIKADKIYSLSKGKVHERN